MEAKAVTTGDAGMLDEIVVGPMTREFILWRCLHGGPLTQESIGELPAPEDEWRTRCAVNAPLLEELVDTYGTCAILARHGEQVVGSLRFYPKAVISPGELCLQSSPTGPSDVMARKRPLPSLGDIEDKTLAVHCMATGSPFQAENPYQRKGLGRRLVHELIRWAREKGWRAIEANAVEDLSILYEHTGMAGKRFWEKMGFRVVETRRTKRGSGWFSPPEMFEQAAAAGLDPDVSESWTMRMDLI